MAKGETAMDWPVVLGLGAAVGLWVLSGLLLVGGIVFVSIQS
jgi:hypothetical protein